MVEKNTQKLFLYTYDGISYRQLYCMSCSTGEVPGAKMCSGDKKTPEGVYFFTKKFKKRDLTPIYGTRAFPIDYPNLMDRLAGKGGNSIWLHGTNKLLKARDSNGCVVLENTDIEELEKYITLNRTPIIIVDKLTFTLDASARNNAKEAINNFLLDWNEAFQKGTCQDYLSFYDPAYGDQILWWPDWQDLKNELETSEIFFTISPRRISIFKHGSIHVVFFDEILKFSDKTLFIGSKKLFLRFENNYFRIVGEKYQIVSKNQKNLKKTNPRIEAYRKLIKMIEGNRKIGRMIGAWDCLLVRYREDCYMLEEIKGGKQGGKIFYYQ
ncbi:MAG: L,D-transpeptidase family protein [Desulfobacterales bacterium]|nr:L,D-transpeptidase family protein [Desulfobacterales bacterium]